MDDNAIVTKTLEDAKQIIEAFGPVGTIYYLPPEDGDDEHDRLRDIKLTEEIQYESED